MSALLFASAMIDHLILLLINIYNIINLSDLEADLMNVRRCCDKLSQTFFPELALHVILTVFFIFNNQWFLFLFNVPIDMWAFYKFMSCPPGQLGIYDPLEINNRRNIKTCMRDFLIRLSFYLIFFFVYLFLQNEEKFDLALLASFGQLLPKSLIDAFPLGVLNVHPSLLPRWRGSSPLIYTIASGDSTGGVSIMKIRPKHFDIGPILLQEEFPLSSNLTMFQLLEMTAKRGCSMLDQVLANLDQYLSRAQEQSTEGVTYAHKLNKFSFFIDWNKQTVEEIDRLYRALNELANLRTSFRNEPVRLKDLISINDEQQKEILSRFDGRAGRAVFNKSLDSICIRCKNGWVAFKNVSLRKSMSAKDFHNGYLSKIADFHFESVHNSLFDHVDKNRIPK